MRRPHRKRSGPSQTRRGKPAAAERRRERKTLQRAHEEEAEIAGNLQTAGRGQGIGTFNVPKHERIPEPTEAAEPQDLEPLDPESQDQRDPQEQRQMQTVEEPKHPEEQQTAEEPQTKGQKRRQSKAEPSGVEETTGADAEARDMEAGSDTAKGQNRGEGGFRPAGAATGTAGAVKATGEGARKPKGTSLSESIVNQIQENPSENSRRVGAGDHETTVCVNGRTRVWKQVTVQGADNLRIEVQVCVGLELPGSCCQMYVTGSRGISH